VLVHRGSDRFVLTERHRQRNALTQDDGWARLMTNIGSITPGTYAAGVGAEFAGNAIFPATSGSATLTVSRATPVVTWNPAAIVEGTPLGPNQLNATADTAGTFFYSQQAGAILGPGLRRLFATFVPVDTTDYNTIGVQAYLAVRTSNPQVSFVADEIGNFGGTSTELTAFNNLGQAAGYSYLPATRRITRSCSPVESLPTSARSEGRIPKPRQSATPVPSPGGHKRLRTISMPSSTATARSPISTR
jgi:hypothetical protein